MRACTVANFLRRSFLRVLFYPHIVTLYAAFVEEIAELKRTVAGSEILRKPLKNVEMIG